MKPSAAAAAATAAALWLAGAQAQPADALYLRSLAATCAQCHGTNGRGGGPATPRLAGRPRADLLAALQAYRAGTRGGVVMPQIARGYTDAQLAQLATYFSARP